MNYNPLEKICSRISKESKVEVSNQDIKDIFQSFYESVKSERSYFASSHKQRGAEVNFGLRFRQSPTKITKFGRSLLLEYDPSLDKVLNPRKSSKEFFTNVISYLHTLNRQ